MKRLACMTALAAVAVAASAAAQPAKPVKSAAPASSPALDPGNISGVWLSYDPPTQKQKPMGSGRNASSINVASLRDMDGNPIELQPWAQAIADQRLKDAREGHPFAHTKSRCLPAGLPKSMDPPNALPMQILINPGQITILFEEFNDFRIIHMGGKHPAADDLDPTFFGHSIGHWEGKTLVVDSVGFTTETTINSFGMPHSEEMHVVERIRRTGPNTLEDLMTIEDPKAYKRPWKMQSVFRTRPGLGVMEYYCVNDRNTPDETGRTGVQLPGR